MPWSKTESVGMDKEQMKKDSAGWKTTVGMVTGGTEGNTMDGGGPMVGNCYSNEDPMGEEYSDVTYVDKGEPY
jgi:hypothetical protein